MDYEKKYKEALEKARMYRDNAMGVEEYSAVARYENIFPELRESEDEKIRKELLSFIESVQHNYLCANDRREKWIAYLEKQKESKLAEKYFDLTELLVPPQLPHNLASGNSEKLNNQWSDEDKAELYNILAFIKNDIPINADTRKEFYHWLKSLRPSWKPSEEQMTDLFIAAREGCEAGSPTSNTLKTLYKDLEKL